MDREKVVVTFEKYAIRRQFDEIEETWYFTVIDVVAALMDSVNPWFKIKIRVKTEDRFELSTICRQINLQASVSYA